MNYDVLHFRKLVELKRYGTVTNFEKPIREGSSGRYKIPRSCIAIKRFPPNGRVTVAKYQAYSNGSKVGTVWVPVSTAVGAELQSQRKEERKYKKRAERHPAHWYEDGVSEYAMTLHDSTMRQVLNNALHDELNNAMNTLSEKQRRYLELHYSQGYTHQEIALMEAVTRQSVSVSIKRALHNLESLIKNE